MKRKRKMSAKERELEKEWFKVLMKWGVDQKKKKAEDGLRAETISGPLFSKPIGRDYPDTLPSKVTPGGSTALKGANTYTGTAMKGIGTLHKSNAIPVFDTDLAVDMASMRR